MAAVPREPEEHIVREFTGGVTNGELELDGPTVVKATSPHGSRGNCEAGDFKGRYTMGWEVRKGRGRYYTRSRRVGGRVVREYVGTGRIAEIMADFDAFKRNRQLIEAEEWKQRVADDAAIEAEVEQLCRVADLFGRAVLVSSGYHNHRGEWRKRRGQEEKSRR